MASSHPVAPIWIIGFTGHRPTEAPGRSSQELEHVADLIREELDSFNKRAKQLGGSAELLCGVAAGADLIAAREAASLGMPVHVILPVPEFLFQKDFEGELAGDWPQARHFIDRAKAGEDGATFRIAEGSHLRDDCYYDVGAQIVYASDAIIALWDGQNPEPSGDFESAGILSPGRGGTADIRSLAHADQMPYVREDPPIKCCRWFITRIREWFPPHFRGYQWLTTPLRTINPLTRTVTGDASNFAIRSDAGYAQMEKVRKALKEMKTQGTPEAAETREMNVRKLIGCVDSDASDYSRELRRALLWSLALHFVASTIAAISASAQDTPKYRDWVPSGLAGLELVLIAAAIWIMIRTHVKHAQAHWLELRLAMELTRGLDAAGRLLDPLFPVTTERLPGWRRFCISMGLRIWRESAFPAPGNPAHSLESAASQFDQQKQQYLTMRIEDQMTHYQNNDPSRRYKWHKLAEKAGPVLTSLAAASVFAALVHKVSIWIHPQDAHDPTLLSSLVYYFLPIALPLLAAAVASLQLVTDVKRRAHVYPEMRERLNSARLLLAALRTPASLRRFVRRTELILLDELLGWYAAARGISH